VFRSESEDVRLVRPRTKKSTYFKYGVYWVCFTQYVRNRAEGGVADPIMYIYLDQHQ